MQKRWGIKCLNYSKAKTNSLQAYESIGSLDAIPGFVNPMRSRLDFLGQSSSLSTILLESDHLDRASGQLCVDIMKGNGLWSFAKLQQHQNVEPDYEIFWRLGQWDSLTDRQTMRDLIRPFAGVLLHKWSSQRWPISK